jgi:hypothetical protein
MTSHMDTAIEEFIASQPSERQQLLRQIHKIISTNDKTVIPNIEPMMGIPMIIYKDRGVMKYGLSGVKKHMSLHLLPIYTVPALHTRYKALLTRANFQKGCINFTDEEAMPLDIVGALIADCATIDLLKIRADYLQSKKTKKAK